LTLANVLGTGNIDISDTAGGLNVTAATTTDGNITLNATAGLLDVTTVTAGGAGDVQLTTTTSGNVNVGSVTALGDTVTITSAGSITDGNGGAVNVVADALSATAQTGIDLDTTLTTLTLASVLAAGNINIADTDGLIVTSATAANGNIDISAAGMLTVASATTTSGGNITLSATGGDLDVTTANAGGNGDIQLTTTTSGNVNVGTVTATGDDVTITSAGAITDANGAAANMIASTLSATAQSGIDLDTTITTLTLADVLAAGTINIADTDGLAVTTATTFDGNITLGATGGTLDVTTVTAGGAGDIQLTTTTSGNVNLGAVTAAGNTVSITSAGAITDGNGGAVNLTADSLMATATSFGASGNPIETDVNSLNVDTSTAGGDQFITEANGLTALNLNAGGGDVNLTLTLGGVADADAATDITAGDLTVVLSDAAAQNFGASGNTIQTSVGTLSANTSAGNGSQFITEANGLTALNLNAGGGDVNLTLSLGTLADTDAATDIAAANVTVGANGSTASIGAAANPIKIDASGALVDLRAQGGSSSGVHLEVAQAGNIRFTDSQPIVPTGVHTLFQRNLATIFDVRYVNDLTVRANGNISSTMAPGTSLLVPGTLTLNAVGAGSSIGGGIANPFAIDVGTLNASAGGGLSFSEAGNVTLGNILGNVSGGSGAFFINAANTLTFNNSTVINAGVGGTAFLVANGIPGISVVGNPTMTSRFLLYALNAELTDPPVIINTLGKPSIGALIADAIDSPRNFNPATPDPFGDLLNYFVFSLEANPPTDPSLFIDIPVEVFQPVSIVFGEYDPTKFGEVGDLWMSSSELYEIERKARKARKALPVQVNRSKYTPSGN
jgi:hypothetical protein